MAAKATAVVYLLADQSIRMYGVSRQVSVRPSPALYGVYKVERLSRNGQEAAPGVLRSWELVVIDRAPGLLPSALVVRSSGETWQRYPADYDDAKQVVTISTGGRAKIPFTYARAGADAVVLKGMLDNQPSEISLRRVPAPRFLLTDPAAMHWSSIW